MALEQLLPLIKQSKLESLVNATLATKELELKEWVVLIAPAVLVVLQCVPFSE